MEKSNRRLIIGVIIVGAFISSLSQTVMTASLPKIMVDFQISAGVGQWLTTAYMLFLGIMIPCTRFLMDRFSTKRLFLASIFLFFLGCTTAAFANQFYILLIARIIQALGAGILMPLPQVVTFRLYEFDQRGTVMGLVGLSVGFAPAFGPTVAGWIADSFGWRTIFYILSALALISILLGAIKLKDEKLESKEKLDVASVILSTLGFSGILTGVTNQGNYGFMTILTLVPFVIGVICLALFVLRQLRIPSPLLELHVFKNRNFTLGCVLLVFAYGSMLSAATLIAIYIQNCRGYSATLSGLTMLPGALFLAFLNPITGRILDKKGPFLLALLGLLFLGFGTLFMGFMGMNTSLVIVGLAYALRMLGVVSILQPLMTWSVNSIPQAKYISHATAIMNTTRQIGGAIVSAIFVTIMTVFSQNGDELHGIHASLLSTAALLFLCVIPVVLFMGSGQEKTEERKREEKPVFTKNHLVITIAREYGSGGRQIGEKLAKELGIAFYDKELIAMAVEESGFSMDYVENHEEITPANSLLYHFAAKNYETYENTLYGMEKFSTLDTLFDAQKKIIQEIAEKEPCVIIGRCADYILKDYPNCYRIFIRSDVEPRRVRIVTEYGDDAPDAQEELKRQDKNRAFHYWRYTNQEWGNAKYYHMVLDSGIFGIDKTVQLILNAVKKEEPNT